MSIVVGCTLAPYKMVGDARNWSHWLENAQAIRDSVPGIGVRFLAALEGRPSQYAALTDRMQRVGLYWDAVFFTIENGDDEYNSGTRLIRICTGRNLIQDYAIRNGASHILFLDSDICPPPDVLPKLLELGEGVAGFHVPTYCLDGRRMTESWPDWDVRLHMNTAGALLVRRDVFTRVAWRYNPDAEMTDDPCYHQDARALGYPTYVRHDVIGRHYPEAIGPIEDRHSREAREIR